MLFGRRQISIYEIHKIGLKNNGHLLIIHNQHGDVLKFSNIKTTAMMMLEFDEKIK